LAKIEKRQGWADGQERGVGTERAGGKGSQAARFPDERGRGMAKTPIGRGRGVEAGERRIFSMAGASPEGKEDAE